MKLIRKAVAGTLESSDALVEVSPAPGVELEIESAVMAQFGDAIEKVTGKRFTLRARCSAQAAKPRTLEELLENAKNSGIPTTAVT